MPKYGDDPARALTTLERLLEIPTAELDVALSYATDAISAALDADKVDAFRFDPSRESLVAVGTSHQPLSARQRKLGLDVMPLANGGRAVQVYLAKCIATTHGGELTVDSTTGKGARFTLTLPCLGHD